MKKFLALAVGAFFSLNASAGYIAYGLEGGAPGLIIQDDTNKSVVFASFGPFQMTDKGDNYHRNGVISETTSFVGMGPTNMLLFDEWPEDIKNWGRLMFSNGDVDKPETFNYTLSIDTAPGEYAPYKSSFQARHYTLSGYAHQVAVPQYLIDSLNDNDFPNNAGTLRPLAKIIPYYDPNQVPEPGSLALLGIGLIGLARAARRRK